MQDEIELKLAVDFVDVAQLDKILNHFKVVEKQCDFLANTYYDTSDQFFTRHKMGLRVRRQQDNYTLTLKTDGNVSGGLHMRPEYNVTLPDAKPDLNALIEEHGLQLGNLKNELHPIFSTDFERQSWLVQYAPNCQIEVAFDQGNMIAGDKRQPIREIEFEIKSGELAPFFAFVMDFLTRYEGSVHFYSVSKAKRGYQLVQGKCAKSSDWIEHWRGVLQTEKRAQKTSEKLLTIESSSIVRPDEAVGKANVQNPLDFVTALLAYEQSLIEETLALGANFFAADFIKSVERVGAFFNLYHYYEDNKSLLEKALNEQLAANRHYAQDDVLTALTEENDRILAQLHDIIRLHSESKDNASAMNKLLELIQTPQYAQRMLHLITLTIGG
ncbi:adenylate cyclase [Aggregatibacter actinomycetemcomitans]|uniref:Adenylate cyclase n=1 Tax=Aggregatibacter actinomycetemcomitans TaxID=714 RepID=A0A5D0EP62_AGGAC|nr:CYTH domain-containing protein [Aggregatibacter actinomycetemcomitans]AFI86325.1 adenylate cyclase [Aggregatibacter actinomycetemcomitans D7S-1]KYK94789.1 adenylate cyclase [Aggregatibacter actinomycetemcomitans serotype d str. SA3733]AMQ93378.1 adenylate cyclase [Aggregatibacter actinomycetemcomitans]ANU82661.1 adenylate cyclase [Aggregatibacter actinomycetemcomitans]EKX95030.1 adenylate cyclase [Aggregatibacter actinomycetemcomitans Y4]